MAHFYVILLLAVLAQLSESKKPDAKYYDSSKADEYSSGSTDYAHGSDYKDDEKLKAGLGKISKYYIKDATRKSYLSPYNYYYDNYFPYQGLPSYNQYGQYFNKYKYNQGYYDRSGDETKSDKKYTASDYSPYANDEYYDPKYAAKVDDAYAKDDKGTAEEANSRRSYFGGNYYGGYPGYNF